MRSQRQRAKWDLLLTDLEQRSEQLRQTMAYGQAAIHQGGWHRQRCSRSVV